MFKYMSYVSDSSADGGTAHLIRSPMLASAAFIRGRPDARKADVVRLRSAWSADISCRVCQRAWKEPHGWAWDHMLIWMKITPAAHIFGSVWEQNMLKLWHRRQFGGALLQRSWVVCVVHLQKDLLSTFWLMLIRIDCSPPSSLCIYFYFNYILPVTIIKLAIVRENV